MASNDPTDTGGLFVGRRPGTGPLRYRGTPTRAGARRRTADRLLAYFLLAVEVLLCLSLWGPQPVAWLRQRISEVITSGSPRSAADGACTTSGKSR